MGNVVLGGAEHHLRTVAVRHPAQQPQELVAVHLRHVPVEQHRIRHLGAADFERPLAVLGLGNLEIEPFENSPCHLANDARIVNDQTGLHRFLSLLRMTPLDHTISASPASPHAASKWAPTSRTRSTSSTTMRLPSSRCTPADTRASRASRLTGLSSRLDAGSFSTSPTASIRRP